MQAFELEQQNPVPLEICAFIEGLIGAAPPGLLDVETFPSPQWQDENGPNSPVFALCDILFLPNHFETFSPDERAFAVAYGLLMDPMSNFLDEAKPVFDVSQASNSFLKEAPIAAAAISYGFWQYITKFAARERQAIADAVQWIGKAGFDPNGGVSYFISFTDWIANSQTARPLPKLTRFDKVKANVVGTLLIPFGGALSIPLKKDPPLLTAADRAAVVRAACVKAGFR